MKLTTTHFLFIGAALLGSLTSTAHADCTLGRDQFGYTTVKVNGLDISSHSNLDKALASLAKMKSSGVCDEFSACTLGKDQFGYITVKTSDTEIASYSDIDKALAAYEKLDRANACSKNSACKLGKDQFGYITVNANGAALASFSDLDKALTQLDNLRNSGLCGDNQPNEGSCQIVEGYNGYSVYTKRGALLIGTYRDFRLAKTVKQALVRAEACR